MAHRSIAGLCAIAAMCAGEADPRAQARLLWTEASQASDVWTCLQLEEWGREQKPALRLNPVLAGSIVTGSTLLAFPDDVVLAADHGDRLQVLTYRRLFTLASDGRPLRRSLPLPLATSYHWFGFAGQALVSVLPGWDDKAKTQVLTVQTTAVDAGRPIFQSQIALKGKQYWIREDAQVANDGSAAALGIGDSAREWTRSRSVTICLVDRQFSVPDLYQPSAIGPKGAWLVGVSGGKPTLVRGERRQEITVSAGGPGMLAVAAGGKAFVVHADATEHPLDPGQALGKDPLMATVGGWLVLDTGDGGTGLAESDLLGDGPPVATELPSILALWRWSDLAKDPAAKPALITPGRLSVAANHPAALVVWAGTAIDLLDLTGREPQRSHLFDSALPVSWAWYDQHLLTVLRQDGSRALYGPDKTELWSGTVANSWLKRRDMLLTSTIDAAGGFQYQLQRLSASRDKRGSVALELDPVEQEVMVGQRVRDWAIGYHDGKWRRVRLDGKLIDHGADDWSKPAPRPEPDAWWSPAGRFSIEGPHLVGKAAGRAAEPSRNLVLNDAWRFGGLTLLLSGERALLAIARPRAEPAEVGIQANADRFGLVGKQAALLDKDGKPVAMIGTGPKLLPKPVEAGRIEEMPAGLWRLEAGNIFVVPHGRQLVWDGDRIGFHPVRLRSPDGIGLFVVTRSALIELDPDAARVVGKAVE